MTYDPQKHHRKSIRKKGHNYAGGGVYFVTICAHRSFRAARNGRPFHAPGMRELIARIWESLPGHFGGGGGGSAATVRASLADAPLADAPLAEPPLADAPPLANVVGRGAAVKGSPYVIMPDHFHALITLRAGGPSLGRVIGTFKSLVVHEASAGEKRGEFEPFEGKTWHRNYYETIVRTEEQRQNISQYIRLNPMRLQLQIDGMMAFGNPALWQLKKVGVLASGNDMPDNIPEPKEGWAWISGFHSAQEEAVLKQSRAPAIRVTAVGPEHVGLTPQQMHRLADGTLLVLGPFKAQSTTRENALKRNQLVAEQCDKLWIPSCRPGGSLETLRVAFKNKIMERT